MVILVSIDSLFESSLNDDIKIVMFVKTLVVVGRNLFVSTLHNDFIKFSNQVFLKTFIKITFIKIFISRVTILLEVFHSCLV